ncbi:MAG TPA: hypothetical protein PKD64_03210 [Pirellulaceae bacterium]|nr:hypothetical protein [Pirellulaceae bacterium]HMO91179.1 hypothetical protein [Pirellulaceae bacterium]HMP69051.1 hypothetical protein [Pirellulaceae bacterium]
MNDDISDADLEAYLDEALDPERAAMIEQLARVNPKLIARMSQIHRRRDAGVHTLGEIWRKYQIGVPRREVVSQYLLNVLPEEYQEYIDFRVKTLRCPFTIALIKDLQLQLAGETPTTVSRRKKIYHSSAGLLQPKEKPKKN